MKTKQFTLLSLAMALTVGVSGAFASNTVLKASADEATNYKVSTLFSADDGGELISSGEDLQFSFTGNKGEVQYNKDLAYKWFTAKNEAKYLTTSFAFDTLDFNSFTVTFQAKENNVTDKKTTKNKIVFKKDGATVNVVFVDPQGNESTAQPLAVSDGQAVTISLAAGSLTGEYAVTVKSGSDSVGGTFTNVYGSYAEANVDIIPITYNAEVEGDKTLSVTMLDLNGQKFELTDGEVVDTAAPVLAVNGDIKNFTIGTKLMNFEYEVIDVLENNVTKAMQYYKYDPETVGEVDVTTLEKYSALSSSTIVYDGAVSKTEGEEYVSIAFKLTDKSVDPAIYQLAWYAPDASDVVEKSGVDFLKVVYDEKGPAYTCINTDDNDKTQSFTETAAYEAYVAAVKEAAKDLKAGDGYKFYLPSLEDLIVDEETPYSGLTFTIYYKSDANSSVSTQSSLSFSNLAIPVSSAGRYNFKVVATDKSGNEMYYWHNDYQDKITSSNIFTEDLNFIPTFSFYVENTGISIEEVKKGAVGTVGQNYSVGDFSFKGVSGYSTEYELFYLEDLSVSNLSHDDFIALVNEQNGTESFGEDALIKAIKDKTGVDVSLRKIDEVDNSGPRDEDEEGWESHDNRYSWRPSSRTFTPREIGYYVVKAELYDKSMPGTSITAYKVVYVSSEMDEVYGDTYWIENNVVTIVFASIAVVSAVGLLIVFVAFPNKGGKKN